MSDQTRMPFTEEQKRQKALSTMEEEPLRRYLLKRCREYAKRLFLDRKQRSDEPYVCADDVRRYLEDELDPPEWLDRNFMGACFTNGYWEADGYVRSKQEGSHGNLLTRWRYVGGDGGSA